MNEQMRLLIEANKELYAAVEFKMEVEGFLKSKIGKYLIARAEAEREEAIRSLVNVAPVDVHKISELQSTIKRAESIQYWMAELITEGVNAEEQLKAQDRAMTDEADQE